MNKKQLLTVSIAGIVLLSLTAPVFAQSVTPTNTLRQQIRQDRQDIKADRQNLRQTVKNAFARIINGTVTGVSGSTITVSSGGKTITVNTDSNTKFRRHFWGASSISEIQTNDKVNVWGSWTDDAHTTMTARLVRDLSIMKRFGVFFGTVQSTNSTGFVMASINRGNQTVTVASTTKYINRKNGSLSLSDISVGSKVRVRGMWDKMNSTITEVKEVKDFSLPINGAVTSPTPSTAH